MLVLSNEVAKHLIDSIIGMQMLEATVVTSMSKKKIETHSLASKFVTHMLDTKAKGSDEEVEECWRSKHCQDGIADNYGKVITRDEQGTR
jgi:hypothetical protein